MKTNSDVSFDRLYQAADWSIRLPDEAPLPSATLSIEYDQRSSERVTRHGRALMRLIDREWGRLFGIVTRDQSAEGFGFYSPVQLEEGDEVRILLPHSWLELNVVRCRKLALDCYESGGIVARLAGNLAAGAS